jgi:hypothetical protein
MSDAHRWPELPYEAWKDTCETLHLWTQVVGKVKLQLSPFLNELWNVGFHLTARGMTTGLMPFRDTVFEVRFDFVDHNLAVLTDDGRIKRLPLMPRSVADFYDELMSALRSLGVDIEITTQSVEMPEQIELDQDREHASYDPEYVNRWWRIMMSTEMVLKQYRSPFIGKSSPVLFYWGSFDLAEARYSGRPAPKVQGPRFYQIAEDEENVACGFWPGNPTAGGVNLGEAAFYSYTSPAPPGFADAQVEPSSASYNGALGEFILPYQDARSSESPDKTILGFFRSAYEAGASLGHWDRTRLERTPPGPLEHSAGPSG